MDKITLKLPKIIFPDVPGDIEVETFDKYEELLDNLSAAFQYWSMERNSQTEFSGGFLYSDMSEKEMDLHGFIFVIRNKGKITYKKAFIFLPLGIMDVGGGMARLTKKFPNELNPKELPDVGVITMKVNEVVRIGMERLTKSGNVKSFHWNVFNHAVPGQSVRNILPVEAMTKDVKFSSDMFVSEIEFSRPLFPKK